jgi:hypothetical protein
MFEIENDFEVAWRRRIGRLVHDRDLLLLGAALERVTQAEQPGSDHCPGRRTPKPIDRPLVLVAVLGLFPIEIVHGPTVCRIAGGRTAVVRA